MDPVILVEQLADPDERLRTAAADGLAVAGAEAVPPLLTALYTTDALHPNRDRDEWRHRQTSSMCSVVGERALELVIDALSRVSNRTELIEAGSALQALALHPARYLPALRHPSASVRERTLCVFQHLGAGALPYAEDIVPLVGDVDQEVAGRALFILDQLGPAALPVLHRLRTGRRRVGRAALTALAQVGGWVGLEAADQALVRRLIAVKLCHEMAQPITTCGFWYAVRSDDQQAVLEAFDLSDPMPVTMRLGGAAAGHIDERWAYATPVIDGWTLVFATPTSPDPADEVVALSHRFGAAQLYYTFEGCGAWYLAESGTLSRAFNNESPEDQCGAPHPVEITNLIEQADLLLEDDELDQELVAAFLNDPSGTGGSSLPDPADPRYQQLTLDITTPQPPAPPAPAPWSPADLGTLIASASCWPGQVAAAASVDPTSLGPDTTLRGTGVLALTAEGRREGPPPGAHPI
jgi:hypothetical protein